MMGLLPGPLLVAAAGAGPDLHRGAVGGSGAGHVEAEAGSAADDSAVRVEGPLLVRAAVAVVDLHPGARRRGMAWHVEALVAVHLQLTVGQGGPLLVGAAGAVPDLQQGPVGRGRPWHVQAPVRAHSPQYPGRTPTTTATTTAAVVGQAPAVLEPVETGLVGDAQGEVGATAVQRRDRAGGVLTRARAGRLAGRLDTGPQDRAHTQAAHRVGEGVQVGDVVGVVVPGPVVVDASVHRHAELGQHCAAGVPAQASLEAGHPPGLSGVSLPAERVHVDREQGAIQAGVAPD